MKSVAVNRNNTETFGKRLRRDWNLNKWKEAVKYSVSMGMKPSR